MERSWNMKISQKVMEKSWNCFFSWLWQLSSSWLSCMLWDTIITISETMWEWESWKKANQSWKKSMEKSKSVMEKSWNSVFQFLWEPWFNFHVEGDSGRAVQISICWQGMFPPGQVSDPFWPGQWPLLHSSYTSRRQELLWLKGLGVFFPSEHLVIPL